MEGRSVSRRKKWPIAKAIARLRTQGLRSRDDFRRWRSGFSRHFPIPYNPEVYYGDEFPGWVTFLTISFVSQVELRVIVQENKLDSKEKYKKFAREFRDILYIPVAPERVYPSLGQKFMGYKNLLYKKKTCISCASKWASESGITTYTEWKKVGRKQIPKDIFFYYRLSGEIDFKKFLQGGYYESNSCTCS